MFAEWKAYLYCSQNPVAVHVDFGGGQKSVLTGVRPLQKELNFLREFMDQCLEDWYQYVSERRSEFYHLNYFTTEQLVMLRRHLASFATSDDDDVPPEAQTLVLLSAVNPWCNADNVRNALKEASKKIMKPAADDEKGETEQEAMKREKALKIVQYVSDEYGFEEKVVWAAIQDMGVEEATDKYMNWCVDHVVDDDEIDELYSELQASEPYLFQDEDAARGGEDDEDLDFKKLPSMRQKHDEFTQSLFERVSSKR